MLTPQKFVRSRFIVTGVVMMLGALLVVNPGQAGALPAPSWQPAIEAPGTATLNAGDGQIDQLSCAADGYCSAVGGFTDSSSQEQAFVEDEVDGTWQAASIAPGTTSGVSALAPGGSASLTTISCSSAGNCAAGGFVNDAGVPVAIVINEVNGVWDDAQYVPDMTNYSVGPASESYVSTISCSSDGNCETAGTYGTGGAFELFVADEVSGTWTSSIVMPGILTANGLGQSNAASISCPANGDCVVVGYLFESVPISARQGFIDTETGGTWGSVDVDPTLAAYNTDGNGSLNTVSCSSVGNCSAGGQFSAGNIPQGVVISEVSGVWQPAIPVTTVSSYAGTSNISCSSDGNCSAVGYFQNIGTTTLPFTVDEVNGTWETANELPIASLIGAIGDFDVNTISCSSSGNCAMGGSYLDASSSPQAFEADEIGGVWQSPIDVPGTDALNTGNDAATASISCSSALSCGLGGEFSVPNGLGGSNTEAFVENFTTSQANLTISPASDTLSASNTETFSTSGGSGTGAVSYVVDAAGSTGCTVTGDVLSATSAGTCTVYAVKASDADYAQTQSADASINFTASTAIVSSPLRVTGLGVTSSSYLSNGEMKGRVDAAWFATPGATSYTYTMLYGYNNPSDFVVVTSTPNCAFYNLALGTYFGVEVVANQGFISSPSVTVFAQTPKAIISIWCHKGERILKRSGVSPVCPAGFKRGK